MTQMLWKISKQDRKEQMKNTIDVRRTYLISGKNCFIIASK